MLNWLISRQRIVLGAISGSTPHQPQVSITKPAPSSSSPPLETKGMDEKELVAPEMAKERGMELASKLNSTVTRSSLVKEEVLGGVMDKMRAGKLPDDTERKELTSTARMLQRFFSPTERFKGLEKSASSIAAQEFAQISELKDQKKSLTGEIGEAKELLARRTELKTTLAGLGEQAPERADLLKQLEPIEKQLAPMLKEPVANPNLARLEKARDDLKLKLRDLPVESPQHTKVLEKLGEIETGLYVLQSSRPTTVLQEKEQQLAEVIEQLGNYQDLDVTLRPRHRPAPIPALPEPAPAPSEGQGSAAASELVPAPPAPPLPSAPKLESKGDDKSQPLAIKPAATRVREEVESIKLKLSKGDLPGPEKLKLETLLIQREERLKVLEKAHFVPRQADMLKNLDNNIFVAMMDRAAPELMLGRMMAKADQLESTIAKLNETLASTPQEAKPQVEARIMQANEHLTELKGALPELKTLIAAKLREDHQALKAEVVELKKTVAALKPEDKLNAEERVEMKELQRKRNILTEKLAPLKEDSPELAGLRGELAALDKDLKPLLQKEAWPKALEAKEKHVETTLKHLDEFEKGQMAWSNIKAEYLSSDVQETFTMTALVDFRKQYSDMMINTLEDKSKAVLTNSGSTDITSDVDINVRSAHVGVDTKMVGEFNKEFVKTWGLESGSAMDVNLYTKGLSSDFEAEAKAKTPKVWANKEAEQLHNEGQEEASLFKMRRWMTKPNEWETYTKDLVDQLPKDLPKEKVDAVIARFKRVDDEYKEFDGGIKARMGELEKQYPELTEFDLEIKATNQIYMEKSKDTDAILEKWDHAVKSGADPKEQDLLWAAATKSLSSSYRYANEAYLSEGPSRHVIGNEQKLKGLKKEDGVNVLTKVEGKHVEITLPQAMQSLAENFGDFMKEYGHHQHETTEEVAIRASKYVGRICRAIDLAVEASRPRTTLSPESQELKTPVVVIGSPRMTLSTEMLAIKTMLERSEPELLVRRKGNTANDIEPAMRLLTDGGATSPAALVDRIRTLVLSASSSYYSLPPLPTASSPSAEASTPPPATSV